MASMLVVRHLVKAMISHGAIDGDQMRAVFDGAKADLHRSTLGYGTDEVDDIFRLIWADYRTVASDIKKH